MSRLLILIAGLFLSVSASAISLEQAYEALKFSQANVAPEGAICEQVAILEFQLEYPADKYEIVNDIEYTDGRSTYGEIDVVVFDKATKKAVMIAEVKCWKSLKNARKKAFEQRMRFGRALASKGSLSLKNREYSFQRDQFDSVQSFIMIAQKGAVAAGFERELEMDLKELAELRRRVETCQTYKNCK